MKQKFSGFFGKRLIPCITVAALFGAFAEYAYIYIKNAEVHAEQSKTMEELRGIIASDSFTETKDSVIKTRQYIGLLTGLAGEQTISGVLIKNTETGMEVVNSEYAEAIVRQNGETQTYYSEDETLLDEMEKMTVYDNPLTNDTLKQPELMDIYVQGEYFLPGVLKQFNVDYNGSVAPSETGVLVDLTPENTDGWEHISADGTNSIIPKSEEQFRIFTITGGTPVDSLVIRQVRAVEQWNNDDSLYIVNQDGSVEKPCNIKTTFGAQYSISNALDADGVRWETYIYTYTNWKRYLHPMLIIGWGMLLIGAFVIAWLWAKIAYNSYRKEYEMAEYRRSLTGALAHDLKSPLTAIAGYAENLRDGIHPEKQQLYAEHILQNTEHMDTLIKDVLQLASLEQSGIPEKETVDLAALANEVCKRFADEAAEKQLSVQCSGACSVSANRTMLSQALGNLIGNAVKYTPEGGCIDISGTDGALTVRNDIPADLQIDTEELIKPFVKGNSARTARNGSGLGLAIVQQIAVLHGFTLNVSAADGKFTAELHTK